MIAAATVEGPVVLIQWIIYLLTIAGIVCQLKSRRYYTIQVSFASRLRGRLSELLAQGLMGGDGGYKAEDILEEQSIPRNSSVGERCIELQDYADYPGMVALHDLAAEEADSDDGRLDNAFPNILISSLLKYYLRSHMI